MTKEELWKNIEKLSELRSSYSCFEEDEEPFYRALSLGIKGIKALEQQPSDDCVSRQAVKDLIMKLEKPCDDIQDFYIDSTQELEVEIDNLPPCTPTHGTCKDCKYNERKGLGFCEKGNFISEPEENCCKDFEKRGESED
jgi:hypothetical protein